MSLEHDSPTSLFVLIVLINIALGLFYAGSFTDVCRAGFTSGADGCTDPTVWGNGVPTNFVGCVWTCSINLVTIFGSSIYFNAINALFPGGGQPADFIGFISSVILTPQGIVNIFATLAAVVLILIGLGIGGSINALTFGTSFQINDSGTRLAQSMGFGLLIFVAVNAVFGGWTASLGTFIGTGVSFLMLTVAGYALYLQAKTIA